MKSQIVHVGSVRLRVSERPDGSWRFGWRDPASLVWHYTTRRNKAQALADARERALRLSQGLTNEPVSAAELAEFRAWKSSRASAVKVAAVLSEYLSAKELAAGASDRHVRDLAGRLRLLEEPLGDAVLSEISPADLEAIVYRPGWSARSRANQRAVIVGFFRWARARGYLPEGPTAAERTERPKVPRGPVGYLSLEQWPVVLAEVRPEYRPSVVLAGFCGVRTQELRPPPSGRKSPLRWGDIDLDRGLLMVRSDTSKVGRRRIVPLCEAALEILRRLRADGEVCPRTSLAAHETARLGALIGGWPQNGLRHSFGVYRAAVTQNLGQVALEMGNSPAMVQAHYWEAVPQSEGYSYFAPQIRKF